MKVMKSILSFAFVIVLNINTKSQSPDKIVIKMTDTVRNLKDCVIRITLSRKDHLPFLFPEKFGINEPGYLVDLLIVQQKLINGKFQDFSCSKGSFPLPDLQGDSLIMKKYDQLTITDSLACLKCLERGTIRLKVQFNLRRADGIVEPANIKAESNWVKFYVVPVKINTDRYRYYLDSDKKQEN